jgi:hypothetical protein
MRILFWCLGVIATSWIVYLLLWAVVGARYRDAMDKEE